MPPLSLNSIPRQELEKSMSSSLKMCFKKWANPGLFLVYFRLFKQTLEFLQQIYVKKCPFSIRRRDSNPQLSDYKSLP